MTLNQHRTPRSLKIPAIAAPMFLVSGPDLVVETCRCGVMGTFPALNQRTSEGYAAWLQEIKERLSQTETLTPFGVNLIVHRTNARLTSDLEVTVQHRVPVVITSLGAVREVVDAIHSYGGLVYHDVINLRHAHKAADAGVDGLIAVCAGAGGHAGLLNPFAFIAEIRRFFNKTLILSGAITRGHQIAAAQLMGADLAYLGTCFIATRESLAPEAYKQMILASNASDIVYTSAISGVHANFLRPSIIASGADPDNLHSTTQLDMSSEHEAKVWKDVWSAGHGVGTICDIPPASELCLRLIAEYNEALSSVASRDGLDCEQSKEPIMRAYEKDYAGWIEDTATAIENGQFTEIDKAALADEVRDLGKIERREMESALEVLLMHSLKLRYQPEKQTRSWDLTIRIQRRHIAKFLQQSPSLRAELPELVADAYATARLKAADETGMELEKFPEVCEWTVTEVVG